MQLELAQYHGVVERQAPNKQKLLRLFTFLTIYVILYSTRSLY